MATRIYLPSSGAAAISPAFHGDWEDTSIGARLAGVTAPVSSAMSTVEFLDSGPGSLSNKDVLFRQYVVGPVSAQTIAAQTVKWQIRAQEGNSVNNMFTAIVIRAFASNGTTLRGTLLALTRDNTEMATAALTNRAFSATTTAVAVSDGDYLVIEIGAGGTPSGGGSGSFGQGHDSRLRIGDAAASDLAEDDSSTTDDNPWIEFADDLFPAASTTRRYSLPTLGVG